MRYKKLGNTGIDVSQVSLGTWAIGGKNWGSVDDNLSIKACLLYTSNKSQELYTLLSDETFKKEDKKRVIDNVFDKDDNIMLKNFLFLLVNKNRIDEIKLIYLDFKNLYLEHSGILNVEVKSANELSEELLDSLKNKLSDKFNKKIILSKSVDKNIIGGIILYINGKMIDLSVKNELDIICLLYTSRCV